MKNLPTKPQVKKIHLLFQVREELLFLVHLHLSIYTLCYFTRVIFFDKKMFILTDFYRRKKSSKVNGRERSSLHCIMTMITERTYGFQNAASDSFCLPLSMNSEQSKYVSSMHF